MGVLWEILQSGFIYHGKRKSDSLEDRVLFLEEQQERLQNTMQALVKKIEEIHEQDLDGDGTVG